MSNNDKKKWLDVIFQHLQCFKDNSSLLFSTHFRMQYAAFRSLSSLFIAILLLPIKGFIDVALEKAHFHRIRSEHEDINVVDNV